MRASTLCAAIVCSIVLGLNFSARGYEPPAGSTPAKEFFPQPTEREEKLDAVLAQPLSISFADTPLSDVAAWFSSKLEVPVILDYRSLEDAGIGADTPVTRKADGLTARTALKLVLGDLDLSSQPRDGVLLIWTQDREESELITRVYPVGDLTPLAPVRPAHVAAGGHFCGHNHHAAGAITPEKSAESAATHEQPAESAPEADGGSPALAPDFHSLIEVIKTTVKPQTWDEVGGPGSIARMPAAKSIVVSQTREVHGEILELIRALRGAMHASEAAESK